MFNSRLKKDKATSRQRWQAMARNASSIISSKPTAVAPRKLRGSRFPIDTKEVIEFRERNRTIKSGETALLCDRFCGANEAGPRRPCQRGTNANPPHSHCSELGNVDPDVG